MAGEEGETLWERWLPAEAGAAADGTEEDGDEEAEEAEEEGLDGPREGADPWNDIRPPAARGGGNIIEGAGIR